MEDPAVKEPKDPIKKSMIAIFAGGLVALGIYADVINIEFLKSLFN
jgi:hypothetical protein